MSVKATSLETHGGRRAAQTRLREPASGQNLVGPLWRRRVVKAALVGLAVVAATIGWRYLRWNLALASARSLAAELSPSTVPQIPASALDEIKAISLRYPQDSEVAYLLGVAYRRAGQMTKARQEFTRAEQLGFSLDDLRRQHYLILFQTGEIKNSEPHLLNLLREGCSDSVAEEIYECLMKGYLADLRLSEAMVCADYWIEWQPRAVRARLLRAMVLEMALERSRLLQEYREILEIDPDCAEAHVAVGNLLLKSKDIPAAQQAFRRCLELNPQDMRARLGLAATRRQLGEPQSKALLLESLKGNLSKDQQSFVLSELGQLAIQERDYKQALGYLQRAVAIAPDDSSARYAMGLALSRLGDKAAADDELEKSRRLESLNERLSDVMHEVIRQPQDAASRCEAGEIMLELGLEKESLACLLSALRCEKWHEKTHRVLARYYTQLGKKDMADRHLAWAEQSLDQASRGGEEPGRAP
jgi:Flp pilus assembly protein TadD